MKINLIVLAILIIIAGVFLNFASEYAFKKIFLRHKKNKDEAFKYLDGKRILDKDIYNEVNIEEQFIESVDGLKLKGFLIDEFKESNKYLILIHGYSANHHVHMPFVRMFLKEGFNILLVDERNHGESDGDYPSYGYFESMDIDRWIEFLEKRNKDKKLFLGLHGQSMGGATALICGSRNDKVDFIIDDCGYSSGREVIKSEFGKKRYVPFAPVYAVLKYKIRKRCGFDIDKVLPIVDICRRDVPILFIHGDEDELVPCEMAKEMFRRRNNAMDKLLIVEGAKHMECYGKKKEGYEDMVRDFLKNVSEIKMNKYEDYSRMNIKSWNKKDT